VDFITNILIAAVSAGTPLLFASLGAILTERSGVLNLGVEGMMLIGAVCGYMGAIQTDNLVYALIFACIGGGLLGLLHALLTITLTANQVVSGLAITLFGTGLSAYLGQPLIGIPLSITVPIIELPFLSSIPVVGPAFFRGDLLIWLSYVLVILIFILIYKTSWGLNLRAIGDNPATADAMGQSVVKTRYFYVVIGGMLAGLGGAYLSLVYTPSWAEGMTAGRGWIAVALVIFARWNPVRALFGAYFFGGLDAIGFHLQLTGIDIPSYYLKMVPYLLTIAVLIFVGYKYRGQSTGKPEMLGQPYVREERY